jgi:hypothetical protein
MLKVMDEKLNKLLSKQKTKLPLRDPLNSELFEVFRTVAGSKAKYKLDLKCAQVQIAYIILFYIGLMVNEIRFFQLKDIQDAIKTPKFNIIHFKQKESYIRQLFYLSISTINPAYFSFNFS